MVRAGDKWKILTLRGVYYCPELSKNILSLQRVCTAGGYRRVLKLYSPNDENFILVIKDLLEESNAIETDGKGINLARFRTPDWAILARPQSGGRRGLLKASPPMKQLFLKRSSTSLAIWGEAFAIRLAQGARFLTAPARSGILILSRSPIQATKETCTPLTSLMERPDTGQQTPFRPRMRAHR